MNGHAMRSNLLHRWVNRFRRGKTGDEGVAMIMVIGVIGVVTTLVLVALSSASNFTPQARRDQDWNAALAAAQAGVDDYLAKLNRTDTYWTSIDCANVALRGPKQAGSCGYTSSTTPGWQQVRSGVATSGHFHYDVDTSDIYSDGSVWLSSTGKVNGTTRTIQVRVSKGSSTSYLYYTDFENADPANKVPYPSGAPSACGGSSDPSNWKYFWQTRSGCSEITFIGGDVLDGKAHFNDSPLMTASGGTRPRFLQGYDTADPNCTAALGRPDSSGNGQAAGQGKCWRSTSGTTPYVGAVGAKPASLLYLTDNSDTFATFPGCVYTGDTRIRFLADGTMDVWNTSGSPAELGPGTPGGTNCGTAAFSSDASGRPTAPQNVPVPNDMVIYVKNSGTTQACVPGQVVNGSASGSTSTDVIPQGTGTVSSGITDISYFDPDSSSSVTRRVFTRSTSSGAWTPGATTGPTVTASSDDHPSTYDCGSGNVYIEGTVKGRVTIASQNNIIVTANLLLSSTSAGAEPSGTDMAGLVAGNSVVVYHPVQRSSSTGSTTVARTLSGTAGSSPTQCSSTIGGNPGSGNSRGTLTCTWTTPRTYGTSASSYSNLSFPGATTSSGNRYIYASMQTLAHSFTVAAYNRGANLGTLSVRGSIAQKWRGAVGTGSGSTGFLKDYSYDQRLVFASPPYFPAWTNAVWGAKTTGELQPQYRS